LLQISLLARVFNFAVNARDSLWLVPTTMVVAAAALAIGLLELDATLGRPEDPVWWLFQGNVDSARTILSVIASSLISVVAVAFSVTIVAIQQASTQFSPRILRNFTRDRGNQVVLGTYIANFVYALLVLRTVHDSSDRVDDFIPAISVTASVVLALVSLGLLVYFIHHVTRLLQVSVLLADLGKDLSGAFEHNFPDRFGLPAGDARSGEAILEELRSHATKREIAVETARHGYLRPLQSRSIGDALRSAQMNVVVTAGIGEYLQRGQTILRVFVPRESGEPQIASLRAAFVTDESRDVKQDPMFGIQQISDIALKALSPGINDPSTAIQCVDQLGNALSVLLDREIPEHVRVLGQCRVSFRVPVCGDFVDSAFAGVARAARTQPHVSAHLVSVVGKLIHRARRSAQLDALCAQVEEVSASARWDDFTPREQHELRHQLTQARAQRTRVADRALG
jgi:uncharacterized membrane protein